MDYEQSVVEFLAQPENLPTALEVARRVEQVKDHLQIRFWHLYRDEMQRRLQASDAVSQWWINLNPDRVLLAPWAKCGIDYQVTTTHKLRIAVSVEAGPARSDCYLIYGLNWSHKQDVLPALPELDDLALQLHQAVSSNSNWWLTYRNVDMHLRGDKFLLRFATEPGIVINELAEVVWTFFIQIREPLEAVNRRLGQPEITA